MRHPLLLVNLLLCCGTSHGQRPFINIFDEFLHQLDVFNLLESPRPPPTVRPLRPVARPPTRPRQPPAPRKPKKLQEFPTRSKLPLILNHGDGAASDAWVKFDQNSSDENFPFAGAHIGGRLPSLPCCQTSKEAARETSTHPRKPDPFCASKACSLFPATSALCSPSD